MLWNEGVRAAMNAIELRQIIFRMVRGFSNPRIEVNSLRSLGVLGGSAVFLSLPITAETQRALRFAEKNFKLPRTDLWPDLTGCAKLGF